MGHHMSHLLEQIAVEKDRISVFEKKIEHCKKRIEYLEFLIQDSVDELDTLASSSVAKNKATVKQKVNVVDNADGYVRSKPIGENQLNLLRFIGKEGKSLKDMVEFAKTNKLNMADPNVRNFAMIYRKKYGYIESPYMAFYRLTESGEKIAGIK
jgi:hypothetical protein